MIRFSLIPLVLLIGTGWFAWASYRRAVIAEQALGMPFHGEANRREMKVVASNTSGPVRVLTLQSTLPLARAAENPKPGKPTSPLWLMG